MKLCTKSCTEPRYNNLGSKVKKNPRQPRFNVMNEENTEGLISLHQSLKKEFQQNENWRQSSVSDELVDEDNPQFQTDFDQTFLDFIYCKSQSSISVSTDSI